MLLVVVRDFNFMGVALLPGKTNPPLIVDRRVAPIRRGGLFMSATVRKPAQATDRTR
jgi:hypothetical protein